MVGATLRFVLESHFARADGSRCPERAACGVPIRVVEKGGTSGHRYPSPGLGFLFRFLCRVLGSLLLRLLLDNPETPFANRRSLLRGLAANAPAVRESFAYFRFGRATSSPPQFGQMLFMPTAQLGQKVHSWLQIRASPPGGSSAPHLSHEALISSGMLRATRALGSPESAVGPLVGLFPGRIDASGVVLVAFSAALRHPRRPLWISEPLRRADVARALLILDLRQDHLRRLTDLRSLSSFFNGAQLRHSAAILACWRVSG